jgi:hypothetical protein
LGASLCATAADDTNSASTAAMGKIRIEVSIEDALM